MLEGRLGRRVPAHNINSRKSSGRKAKPNVSSVFLHTWVRVAMSLDSHPVSVTEDHDNFTVSTLCISLTLAWKAWVEYCHAQLKHVDA